MAIEVKIPREITEYKEKIMFGFTWRQAICIITSASLGFTVFKCFYPYMSIDNATLLIVFCILPIGLIGFAKCKDLPFEAFLYLWFRNKFIVPQNRYHEEVDVCDFISELSVEEVENEALDKIKGMKKLKGVSIFERKKSENIISN